MLPSWPNALRTTAEDVVYSAVLAPKSPSSARQTVFSWQSDIPSHIFVSPKLQTSDILSRYIVQLLQIESLHIKACVATLPTDSLSLTFVTINNDQYCRQLGHQARAISSLSICGRSDCLSFHRERSKCFLNVSMRAFGNHNMLCGKGTYSNNTIPNTFFQTSF